MPKIGIKTRAGGRTAQLVRHCYDPKTKRSRTVSVGSVRLDADPERFPRGVRLAEGQVLDAASVEVVRRWLIVHADKEAAEERREAAMRIKERLRREMESDASHAGNDPLEVAVRLLESLSTALPEKAEACRELGDDPWLELRPDYLKLYKAWEALLKAAQGAGIAKRAPRRQGT